MIEIKGKIVSLEIIENKFVCNLNACKGACCIEGIEGAPLEKNELQDSTNILFIHTGGFFGIESFEKWFR